VVLDNVGLHKGASMAEKRRQWEQQGLYLYYLPPYKSGIEPHRNPVETGQILLAPIPLLGR
jgi:hypothetical protein